MARTKEASVHRLDGIHAEVEHVLTLGSCHWAVTGHVRHVLAVRMQVCVPTPEDLLRQA